MKLAKPLTENALASVTRGMSITSKCGNALYDIEQELKHCKISVDDDSMKHARFYLDQIYASLAPLPLASAQAGK